MNSSRCFALFGLVALSLGVVDRACAVEPVTVNWLGGATPGVGTGVSWGVPWPKGAVAKNQVFTLATSDGKMLPLQAWPLAYWPDGSIKWTGFAAVVSADATGPFTLRPTSAAADARGIQVRRTDAAIEIDTGKLICRLPTSGGILIASLSIGGREVARDGQLVCVLQSGPDGDPDTSP